VPGSAHRSVSFNLAGWLWADLLLGMFAIFLAANALAPSSEAARPAGIDPTPIVMRIEVSGPALLGDDAALSDGLRHDFRASGCTICWRFPARTSCSSRAVR